MIILIGPQSTAEEMGDLNELAGLLGAVCMSPDVDWASVRGFLVAPDWDKCPVASADVESAGNFGLPVEYLKAKR
ncbi:hypothetical protein ACIGW0_31320 [Streptomyces bikiniensis]|uniref:Uncharacterized protein n=1 Tax=Streptomyces bikiniensis TaxID=1896 RepID=A0ABW8D408_STRBI